MGELGDVLEDGRVVTGTIIVGGEPGIQNWTVLGLVTGNAGKTRQFDPQPHLPNHVGQTPTKMWGISVAANLPCYYKSD